MRFFFVQNVIFVKIEHYLFINVAIFINRILYCVLTK